MTEINTAPYQDFCQLQQKTAEQKLYHTQRKNMSVTAIPSKFLMKADLQWMKGTELCELGLLRAHQP